MQKLPVPPTQTPTQDDYVRTAMRIPRELRGEMRDTAEQNGRSMNAEVITRLQAGPVSERLDKLTQDIADIKKMVREILNMVSDR
ncbi:hypothetical protein AAKU55_005284 [Oxalobacteraceae bacterium GrIS 1.11]